MSSFSCIDAPIAVQYITVITEERDQKRNHKIHTHRGNMELISNEINITNRLINALWRSAGKHHQLGKLNRQTSKFQNILVIQRARATEQAQLISSGGTEAYFACAEYDTPDNRTAANASGAYALWMDIDCSEVKAKAGNGYLTEADARIAVKQFSKNAGLPEPTHIVSSGGGLHVYWVLDGVVDRNTWQAYATKLKALTKDLGLLADDSRTSDIASVLRVPGTLNYKYDPPRPVTLLEASDKFIKKASMLDAIDSAHNKFCIVTAPQVPCIHSSHAKPDSNDNHLGKVEALLNYVDPDCEYQAWLQILMAIFHESDGSEAGFKLADTWSKKGNKYKDEKELLVKWNSFKSASANPITIGTLIKMAKDNGANVNLIMSPEDQFEECETLVIDPNDISPKLPIKVAPNKRVKVSNQLDQYCLVSEEIEKNVVESAPILGELALLGQATVFFAAPNTGKTLITMNLLIDAIKHNRADPSDIYYLNMDDTGSGLLEKVRIAEEYGFHMLADGYKDFKCSEFPNILRDMIAKDQAQDVVVILDTLKKFVDLMDKGRTSAFTNVIRPFVLKGGTVIALAHTNKHAGKDGKPIYGGVSDIMNDIDCAYTLAPVSDNAGTKVVEFVNTKRRGNVVQTAAYTYCTGNQISYNEILLSVEPVAQNVIAPLKIAENIKSDAEVIEAVTACINDGINSKMQLADAVSRRAGISRRSAIQIVEKYSGTDPVAHRWNFTVGDRGAKNYILLSHPK